MQTSLILAAIMMLERNIYYLHHGERCVKGWIAIYHIHRMVEETGAVFNDQSHIIYVNSQIKDETALGKLMHDFFCTNAKRYVLFGACKSGTIL